MKPNMRAPWKMKAKLTRCDNCGYESIIIKTKKAICPNCNKNKLNIKGSE